MPENLVDSERANRSEEIVGCLDDACNQLDDVLSDIGEAID